MLDSGWQRRAPNEPGWWIRINARGTPQLHEVIETSGGQLSLEDGLWIMWGSGTGKRLMHPNERHAAFSWFGPLPPEGVGMMADAEKLHRDLTRKLDEARRRGGPVVLTWRVARDLLKELVK